MQTTLSSKGQVVLPRSARDRLRLRPGSKLECTVEGDSIVLKPESPSSLERVYVKDAVSGLVVSKPAKQTSKVSSDTIKELLADFP